jgi:hypothetical protein
MQILANTVGSSVVKRSEILNLSPLIFKSNSFLGNRVTLANQCCGSMKF